MNKIINKILPYVFATASFGLIVRISNISNSDNPAQSMLFNFLNGGGNFNITTIKFFDLLIIITALLLIFNFDFLKNLKNLKPEFKKWGVYFLLLVFFITLGQIIGYYKTGVNILPDILPHYLRTFFNIFTFITTLTIFFYNKDIVKYSTYAIFISPIVITPVFFGYFNNIYLINGHRLTGTMVNPQNIAVWLTVAFIFGIAIFLSQKNAWKKLIILPWLSIIGCFILWTETRGAIIALTGGLLFIFLLLYKVKDFKKITVIALITIFSFSVGHIILPQKTKNIATIRIMESPTTVTKNPTAIAEQKVVAQEKIISKLTKFVPVGLFADQTRLKIWLESAKLIMRNPLGVGFNYLVINPLTVSESFHPTFTVNIFLEIALTGGLGALIIFLALLKNIFSISIKFFEKGNFIAWSWLTASLVFLIAACFTDHFLFRNLWFILGGTAGIALLNKHTNSLRKNI